MVRILGHRGARGLWPENSIQGFRNAIELGVDMIEFDVHLSRDGVPVVIHDHTLERTTTGTGLVAQRTVAELSKIGLRDTEDEGIATLDEVLEALAGSSVTLAVEIKTAIDAAPYPDIERLVLERLRKHGCLDRAMILSFVPECLERVRAIQPDMPVIGVLWRPQAQAAEGLARAIARLDRIPGVIVAVQEELLTQNEALCRELLPPERLAVGINNDPDRMRYWIGSQVRHISTDRPDLALAMRAEQQRGHSLH